MPRTYDCGQPAWNLRGVPEDVAATIVGDCVGVRPHRAPCNDARTLAPPPERHSMRGARACLARTIVVGNRRGISVA